MLFSFNKLKEIANLPKDTSLEQVCQAINSIGFEVEEHFLFSDVKGVKFGKVLEVTKNPNGEKLSICRIEFADKERIIQTAATNVVVGMTVVAFVPGSQANGVTFAAKELKGIMSEGMLSSPSEFGINPDLVRDCVKDGIASYPEIKDLSLDPVKVLGLDDQMIDIKVLSNRADANSYFSMALELAAYFKTKVNLPARQSASFKSDIKVVKGEEKSLAFVEAKKEFSFSVTEQIFLMKHNVKSINDIADLTNLIFLMTGQPTHAYDKKVVGSTFKAGLKSGTIKVFGDKEVKLENNLVITSDDKIVSVAGVIGIEGKGVSHNTTDFILEFGRFNIKDVRRAAKAVKLNTTASNQSSKEFNAALTKWAIDYVSTIVPTMSNVVNEPAVSKKEIDYSEKTIAFLANKDITKEAAYNEAIKALTIIGYEFSGEKVKVAAHISGIDAQQDLNEEVFRFFGYDTFMPVAPMIATSPVQTVHNLHKQVAALGYQEVVTYSLISQEKNFFNPFGFKKAVKLETFVSKEREEVRNSFAPSLLEVITYNQKRKMDAISIFDIGMINDGFKTVALASTTKTFAQMALDLKNLISNKLQFERLELKEVHHGVSAKIILDQKQVGWIGKLHPSLDETNAFVAEVILPVQNEKIVFKDYSNEPLKHRDITVALELNQDVSFLIAKFNKYNVFSIEVKDKFVKENKNNVTLRILASEEEIIKVDKEWNK